MTYFEISDRRVIEDLERDVVKALIPVVGAKIAEDVCSVMFCEGDEGDLFDAVDSLTSRIVALVAEQTEAENQDPQDRHEEE